MRAWVPFVRAFAGNVRFAGSSILEHKLRSTLTVLGIVRMRYPDARPTFALLARVGSKTLTKKSGASGLSVGTPNM